jgi:hypothetical protein
VRLYILSLLFLKCPLLDPSCHFPSLELDHKLVGVNSLGEVEVDVTGYGVSCEVVGLVKLNEHR